MRIVAGEWRGRTLAAPPGPATRPTADRVRQALFDMLMHAPWAGRSAIEGAHVLDAFAGTGALGLEALSRGAATATFVEHDRAALAALRENVARCRAADRSRILALDLRTLCPDPGFSPSPFARIRAMRAPRLPGSGLSDVHGLPGSGLFGVAFLDPPYGAGLIPVALAGLRAAGWLAPGALIIAETGRAEEPPVAVPLAERTHGAARVTVWRAP